MHEEFAPDDGLDLESSLRMFTGSETYYRHGLVRNVHYTEGAQYLAEKAKAYWLLDEVATSQLIPAVRAEAFQSWKLKVDRAKHSAVLTCDDGGKNGRAAKIVHRKAIEYTDFPLDEVQLYFANDVIHLPSEY